MGIIQNVKEYNDLKPSYKEWDKDCKEKEAKKLSYIEKHNLNEKTNKEDINRAKVVLNAVNVMDEFSQSRAEDMEMTIQGAKSFVGQMVGYACLGIGTFLGFKTGFGKKLTENFANKFGDKIIPPGLFVPLASSVAGAVLTSIIMSPWGAKKELLASRNGRFEAMKNALNNPKNFAVLTDEQKQQRDEIAKTIKIDKKEAKKDINVTKGLGVLKSIKTIFAKDKEIEAERQKFADKLNRDSEKAKNANLSEKQILEAKKDMQLVQNVVKKIDIASQDYAENTEQATEILTTGIFAFSVLGGLAVKKICDFLKINPSKSSLIGTLAGIATTIGATAYTTKLQKQASRVARFKIKQEYMADPKKAFYVDEKLAKNEDGQKYLEKEKKENIFKFIVKLVKDNREYNKYLKNENIVQKQKQKALDKIEITPEQEKRAKQLQHNTFKMFNKLDEKSQKYSESVEAVGEIAQSAVSGISVIPFTIAMNNFMNTMLDNKFNFKDFVKKVGLPFALFIVPVSLMVKFITKEQKQASRVANMSAIKEMSDYKNFADFDPEIQEQSKKELSPALKNMINGNTKPKTA